MKGQKNRVFWSIRRLAREFGLHPTRVAKLLVAIGAKKYSRLAYMWECELDESELQA